MKGIYKAPPEFRLLILKRSANANADWDDSRVHDLRAWWFDLRLDAGL